MPNKADLTADQFKEELATFLNRANERGLDLREILRLVDEAAAEIEKAIAGSDAE